MSRDNPFHAGGELRAKADYILTHSRISRHDLHIVDPDLLKAVPSHPSHDPSRISHQSRHATQLSHPSHDVSRHGSRSVPDVTVTPAVEEVRSLASEIPQSECPLWDANANSDNIHRSEMNSTDLCSKNVAEVKIVRGVAVTTDEDRCLFSNSLNMAKPSDQTSQSDVQRTSDMVRFASKSSDLCKSVQVDQVHSSTIPLQKPQQAEQVKLKRIGCCVTQ